MAFKTIEWKNDKVRLLDQTLLPNAVKYLTIADEKAMWEAIRMLRVRGAPAIGVAAAYGLYVGIARTKPESLKAFKKTARKVADYLATSRPTAVNLFWALKRCMAVVEAMPDDANILAAHRALLAEAKTIHAEDFRTCDEIGTHGAPLLQQCKGVITHCNAGALATAGMGTALAVILKAARKAKFTVFADETRPLLQGARLTAWELQQAGVETRLICDNMAGSVLKRGMAQAAVVGADRIAANGDAANKVGTMPLAIVCNYYKVPLYVAAPLSTFDLKLKSGDEIPIEERAAEEITSFGKRSVAPRGTKVFSPAFDVTPAKLIAGIVTEVGVLRPPYKRSIAAAFRAKSRGEKQLP
ncbi:MAG TPA: S-methyl-5-thioribose-1-phosphate isomerase [Candidatus Sumerlaeota bacterium]|nr:S-methyl-5-thioribose-1-phosphate isomerase [Candidatus Sumerlaeota bacterium]